MYTITTIWTKFNHIIFISFFFFISHVVNIFAAKKKRNSKNQDRVLVVQGGYVSQSHGQQLSVTKKSNALDKPKPNILNKSAAKLDNKNQNGSSNNNINNNNDDDTSEHDSKSTLR